MGYYDNSKEYEDRGIDYDLNACLECNPQSFSIDEVKKVLAVHEGENDGDDWRWVLELKDGRFVFLQGGCDYTGWDCQSWASSEFAETPEEATKYALGDFKLTGRSPYEAGLGHMLNILSGGYTNNFKNVYDELMKQLEDGKKETWREKTDKDMPNLPMV